LNFSYLDIVKISMENILTMLKSTRILNTAAMLFLASAVFHAGIWWLAGMPSLEGPVTWRKPMTFGLSTGLLFLSLGWVLSLMPDTPRRIRQSLFFSGLLIAEVALIDMQQWRGVASHFNNATPFDGAVFTAMGVLIITASVVMAWWTLDVLRTPLRASPASAFAVRAGMVLLNLGNLVGLVMAVTQTTHLKPLHGIALHMIQVLPVAVWAMLSLARFARRFGYARTWRDESRGWSWFSLPEWRHR
jgi:hypothetical protein